jgi:hypothetical protein
VKLITSVLRANGRNHVPYWPGIELPTTGPDCAHGEALVGMLYYDVVNS